MGQTKTNIENEVEESNHNKSQNCLITTYNS